MNLITKILVFKFMLEFMRELKIITAKGGEEVVSSYDSFKVVKYKVKIIYYF